MNTTAPSSGSNATTFDYVLVGAGASCMGLLLGLLSPYYSDQDVTKNDYDVPFTIAVLERGCQTDNTQNEKRQDPSRWFAAAHDDDDDSSNNQTQQVGHSSVGRMLDYPTGTGLGGSTNINACLCIPPARRDFESWPSPWNEKVTLSVQTILQHLQRNQCLYRHPPPPLTSSPELPWKETLFPSSVTSIPCTVSNSSSAAQQPQQPPPHVHAHHVRVRRRNYYQALIAPLLEKHPHLCQHVFFFTGHLAERLLFSSSEPNRITGVECSLTTATTNTTSTTATTSFKNMFARNQVILSAGAFETPALLLVSGIGLQDDLDRAGIAAVSRRNNNNNNNNKKPSSFQGAVGHNLRDHVMLSRAMVVVPGTKNPPNSIGNNGNNTQQPIMSINGVRELHQLQVDDVRFQVGIMDATVFPDVLPHVLAGLFRWRLTDDSSCSYSQTKSLKTLCMTLVQTVLCCVVFPTIKRILYIIIAYPPFSLLLQRFVIGVAVNLLNPTSTGSVQVVRRRRRHQQPRQNETSLSIPPTRRSQVELDIRSPYLENDNDVASILQGWNACKVATAASSTTNNGWEFFPGPLVQKLFRSELDPTRFRLFAHATCLPYYHWCGTCSMFTTDEKDDDDNNKDNWVVDAKLCVRDFQGLRICDASVFPNLPSAPIALTCAAVGHVLASMLLAEMDG